MPILSNLLRRENSYIREHQIPFLFCCLASSVAIYTLFWVSSEHEEFYWKLIGALFSFLPTTFLFERFRRAQSTVSKRTTILTYTFLTALQAVVIYTIFNLHEDSISSFIQIIALQLLLHLIIAYFPFWISKNLITLWNSNTRMFLRFLLSQVYGAVLQGALSAALVAVVELFNLSWRQVDDELFGVIGILSYGVLAPFVFLSGNPLRIKAEAEFEYHKILHNFFHYLIRPILWLYFGILYLYIGFNWIQGELPSGILPYLILTVSGILLFYFTMRKPYSQSRNAEVIYSILLLPLILTLFYAVGIRILDYGVTVPRYFVLIIGIIVCINLLFIIITEYSIPILISTLIIGTSLSSFGPLSAIQVSIYSQSKKLEGLIERYTGVPIDKISASHLEKLSEFPADTSDTKLRKNLVSTFQYLEEFNTLEEYLFQNPILSDSLQANGWYSESYNNKLTAFKTVFNLQHINSYSNNQYQYLESGYYDWFIVGGMAIKQINEYLNEQSVGTITIENINEDTLTLQFNLVEQNIQLKTSNSVSEVSIQHLLSGFIGSKESSKLMKKEDRTVTLNSRYSVVFEELSWTVRSNGDFYLDRIKGFLVDHQP